MLKSGWLRGLGPAQVGEEVPPGHCQVSEGGGPSGDGGWGRDGHTHSTASLSAATAFPPNAKPSSTSAVARASTSEAISAG